MSNPPVTDPPADPPKTDPPSDEARDTLKGLIKESFAEWLEENKPDPSRTERKKGLTFQDILNFGK